MIYVCCLHEMHEHAQRLRPESLVSLVEPEAQPPSPPEVRSDRHLRLEIHDLVAPSPLGVLPQREHVERLVDFLRSWERVGPLLVHCVAGISRSTAAALVGLALDLEGREIEAARHLRAAAPHAVPNCRIVELADQVLGRGGRLTAACEAMGPAEPLAMAPLVALPLLR